jgi:hypothetical protein
MSIYNLFVIVLEDTASKSQGVVFVTNNQPSS